MDRLQMSKDSVDVNKFRRDTCAEEEKNGSTCQLLENDRIQSFSVPVWHRRSHFSIFIRIFLISFIKYEAEFFNLSLK